MRKVTWANCDELDESDQSTLVEVHDFDSDKLNYSVTIYIDSDDFTFYKRTWGYGKPHGRWYWQKGSW